MLLLDAIDNFSHSFSKPEALAATDYCFWTGIIEIKVEVDFSLADWLYEAMSEEANTEDVHDNKGRETVSSDCPGPPTNGCVKAAGNDSQPVLERQVRIQD